jgi:hypothetical protein
VLPILHQAVEERAAAVQAVEDAWTAVSDPQAASPADLAVILACGEKLLREQRAFLHAACDYNQDIAEYGLSVASPGSSPQAIVALLIGPSNSLAPTASVNGSPNPGMNANQMTNNEVIGTSTIPTEVNGVGSGVRATGLNEPWMDSSSQQMMHQGLTPAQRPANWKMNEPTPAPPRDSLNANASTGSSAPVPSAASSPSASGSASGSSNTNTLRQADLNEQFWTVPDDAPKTDSSKTDATKTGEPSAKKSHAEKSTLVPVQMPASASGGSHASGDSRTAVPGLVPMDFGSDAGSTIPDSPVPDATSTIPDATQSAPKSVTTNKRILSPGGLDETAAQPGGADAPSNGTPSNGAWSNSMPSAGSTSNAVVANGSALYLALVDADPAMRAKQLTVTLHWDRSLPPQNVGKPVSLVESLARSTSGNQRSTIEAFWRVRQEASQYQLFGQQAEWLDSLTSVLLERRSQPNGPVDMLHLRAMQLATKAAQREAQARLLRAQYDLASRTGAVVDAAWPLASTTPHSGKYLLKLETQPKSLAMSWSVRRLATKIPSLGESVQQRAAAVVDADVVRAAAFEKYLAGGASLNAVLEEIEQQTSQSAAFLETLTDYNLAIADYALTVLPSGTSADRLAASLVVKP